MRFQAWAAAAAVVVIAAPASAAEGWRTYTSSECGYSADLPGEPRVSTQDASARKPGVALVDLGASAFAVSCLDFGAVDPAVVQEAVDGSMKVMVESLNGDLGDIRPVSIGGVPGREASGSAVQDGKKMVYRVRAVFTDGRYYQVIALQPESDPRETMDRFIESFRLTR